MADKDEATKDIEDLPKAPRDDVPQMRTELPRVMEPFITIQRINCEGRFCRRTVGVKIFETGLGLHVGGIMAAGVWQPADQRWVKVNVENGSGLRFVGWFCPDCRARIGDVVHALSIHEA